MADSLAQIVTLSAGAGAARPAVRRKLEVLPRVLSLFQYVSDGAAPRGWRRFPLGTLSLLGLQPPDTGDQRPRGRGSAGLVLLAVARANSL